MRVVITGATGLIGRALTLSLLQTGHDVAVITRDVDRAKNVLGLEVSPVAWSDALGLRAVLDGADAVVNLSGESVVKRRWTSRHKQTLWSSRVDLTQKLVRTMGQCNEPPSVLVSASAVGGYASEGQLSDESSPIGSGFSARMAQAWEESAFRAEKFGTRVVALRLGLVLSRQGAFDSMQRAYRLRCGAQLGDGTQGFPWVHIDDVVGVIRWSLAHDAVRGPLNLVGPEPLSQREVHTQMAQVMGRQLSPRVPRWAIQVALGERGELLVEGPLVSSNALQTMGYAFRYPTFRSAIEDLCAPEDGVEVAAVSADSAAQIRGRTVQYELTARTLVSAPIEEVAPWFETPGNLTLMTPPFMRFDIQHADAMAQGATMTYRLYLFGVPLVWKSEIPVFEPGVCFVDTQTKGPYRLWWHEHTFESAPSGTWVVDKVSYRMPFGWVGRLTHALWVGHTLKQIFYFRKHSMHERFGKLESKQQRLYA